MISMSREYKMDQMETEEELLIERNAEDPYLHYSGEEEEANDNFPDHEILQGCIWRDTESSQQRIGLQEEGGIADHAEEMISGRELDFSDDRRRVRGFLDDEVAADD